MIEAYIVGKIQPNREKDIIRGLLDMTCVSEADIVYGKYDIIAKVVANDLKHLKNVLLEDIRKLSGLEFTQTLVVSNME
jgi:DNA-binding Lrp family transcriptional regulator